MNSHPHCPWTNERCHVIQSTAFTQITERLVVLARDHLIQFTHTLFHSVRLLIFAGIIFSHSGFHELKISAPSSIDTNKKFSSQQVVQLINKCEVAAGLVTTNQPELTPHAQPANVRISIDIGSLIKKRVS